MNRYISILCAVLCLLIVSPFTASARQDVYAFTYNGNNWYVDKDSVNRNSADGLLHFTVYTMIGLRYEVASGSEYYNADVYYHQQKLSTEGGQLLYKNPGILAATRVARQLPDAPKPAPKPATTTVAKPTTTPVVKPPIATVGTPSTAPVVRRPVGSSNSQVPPGVM